MSVSLSNKRRKEIGEFRRRLTDSQLWKTMHQPSKDQLRDMLCEAARNTARQQQNLGHESGAAADGVNGHRCAANKQIGAL